MSVKIIYRPVNKNDKDGFLKIRIIENRKTKIKSLGIKIKGSNWLDDKQRVSKSEPNADQINLKIEEILRELSIYDTPLQAIETTNKTILSFYDSIIANTTNSGTRAKYNDIKKRFIGYLNSIGLDDLKFHQLTAEHVQAFYSYMRSSGSAQNTANYNMKSFKAMINKAINSGLINYYHSPFALLKFKYTETKHKTLTKDEVSRLLNTDFKENRIDRYNSLGVSLNEIVNIFLFQLFAQGMRVSDVQLLKWSNFEVNEGTIILDYRQFKTKKKVALKITPITCKLLLNRLNYFDGTLSKRIDNISIHNDRYIEEISKAQTLLDETKNNKDINKIKQLFNVDNSNNAEGSRLAWELSQKEIIKMFTEKLNEANNKIYNEFATLIDKLSKDEHSNKFVFHFFHNDDLLKNYKEGEELTDKQYGKLQGTRSYYNLLLKEIKKQADIKISLASHVARHTYTQLILNSDADVIAVSKALGHSNLATTQTYISQLPNARLLNINDKLSDSFS
tara:strand:- start:11862 stop:13379 length:1518 start_codon:yes stop_codon:yes gene_type:complete